jgi:hypothetical protein
VTSGGWMVLGTRVFVDRIGDMLNAMMDIVTLALSMVVVVVAQALSKTKPNCRTMRVFRTTVTHILGMVLILEVILWMSFKIKSDCNSLVINCLLK